MMKTANILLHGSLVATLTEIVKAKAYRFEYREGYDGEPVSLTLPTEQRVYEFDSFPPFFDGLLPEGAQLESLLRLRKIDKHDYFAQLLAVGGDLVGAVTVEDATP